MALVLYQDPVATSSTATAGATSSTSNKDSHELDAISKRIVALTSNIRATPYIGLQNQGATCYMNSLIQTLFMSP